MELISVIIPAYNYAHYIVETLQSVANQTYSEFECLIIDDGSTDSTRVVVEEFCRQDIRFKYHYQNNQGLASARNHGIVKSSGDYISFLDADDLWLEGKLANQVKTFNEFDCQAVFSDCRLFYDVSELKHEPYSARSEYSPIDFIDSDLISGSSSSITIRRSVYQMVGLFDINLRSLEDNDYWFRCALNGFIFRFCKSVDIKIRTHVSSMSTNQLKMYYYHLIVIEKQFKLLAESDFILRRSDVKKPLLNRLRRIRWYSDSLKRYDLSFYVHLFGFTKLGLRYFSRLNCLNFFKDGLHLLLKSREIIG